MNIANENCETFLSIITENQTNLIRVERLAELISTVLGIKNNPIIKKYKKIENSYKLEFTFPLDSLKNSIIESLEKTDRLCSPWSVRFNHDKTDIELIFNKSESITYGRNEFNVITWANWEIDN